MTNTKPGILKKLIRNPLTLAGALFIFITIIISVLGYLISPDKTQYANQQTLEIAAKEPGFSVQTLKIRKNINQNNTSFLKSLINGKPNPYTEIPIDTFYFYEGNIFYSIYDELKITSDIKMTVLVDAIYPLDLSKGIKSNDESIIFHHLNKGQREISLDNAQNIFLENNIYIKKYLFGTDRFGRDMLSRMIIGSRVSLSIGFVAVLISLIIGIVLGLLAGYFGSITDKTIMFFVNVVWSIPALLMALALSMIMGKGYWQLFLAIGLTMWVEVARIVRGQVMSVKEKDYIVAARVLGFSQIRILFKHILPNIFNPVIIISAANFSTAILLEAGLSFLGIGIQPPVPSWGGIIRDHYGYIIVDQAFLAMVPGIAIILLVLSFTFIGNGLRDALDNKA